MSEAHERWRRAAGLLVLAFGFCPLCWTLLWRLARGLPAIGALSRPAEALEAALSGSAAGPALAGTALAAAVLTGALAALLFRAAPVPPFGDARFATRREVRGMGLASPSGVIVGKVAGWPPGYLRHGGAHHVLLAAPTRSGKGVGVVLPNLLSWPGSVVVLDIKNEAFEATSGFRARCGQRVVRFAPGDPGLATHRYNPLGAVRPEREHRIADLQAIAHLLVPEAGGEQRMWHQEARALFVGLSLLILDTPDLPLTFGQVLRMLETDADLGEALIEVVRERGDTLEPACANILSNFAHKAFKERSGVKSTLTGRLELWHDGAIDAATARSDFGFETLRREPTSVYVSVSLDQLERLSPLLNLVFQQLVAVAARRLPGADEPCPVLVVLDELASLGRLDLVVERMPFLAGFGVKLLLVVQGLSQLDRLYGVAGRETILQNAGLQLFFAPNDEATSSYVSARLGTRTVAQPTRSRSVPVMGGHAGTVTRGTSFHARPLMSPDEVRRLAPERALLFVEGGRPIAARKIVHHREPALAARLAPSVAIPVIEVARRPPFRFAALGAQAPARLPEAASPAPDPPVSRARRPTAAATAPRLQRRPARRTVFDQLDFDRLLQGPPS